MPTPDKPSLDYSYTAFQEAQGGNDFPGTQLDNDLANLKQSIDETIDFVGGVIRDDGKLQNGIVTKNSMAADVLTGLPAPRPWATATVYAVDDTATTENGLFICLIPHTSAVFSNDLLVGRWANLATWSPLTAVADGTVTTPKIVDSAVTTPKIADASVTTEKLPANAVDVSKLSTGVQALLTPVGAEIDFSGPFAPTGWVFKAGQALSRVTYSALFAVLCPSFIANTASGSPTVSSVSVDLRGLGLEGAGVEGPGVPSGATVASVTATTVVLSVNATSSVSGAQLRLFPHGNGDGASTFNVPDDRGRTAFGRDNMGGTAAGRVKSTDYGASDVNGVRLGAVGGADRVALVSPDQIPAHAHTAGSTVSDPGHAHGPGSGSAMQNITSGTSLPDYIGGSQATVVSGTTGTSTTGITVATTVNNTGSGLPHANMPPTRIANKIIFTGVV